jgi:hypothetical protein
VIPNDFPLDREWSGDADDFKYKMFYESMDIVRFCDT